MNDTETTAQRLFRWLVPALVLLAGVGLFVAGSDEGGDEGEDENGDTSSAGRLYDGNDCAGSGLYVPVVGVVGNSALTTAEAGMPPCRNTYTSGGQLAAATIADITDASEPTVLDALDPNWTDCSFLQDMLEELREMADTECSGCPLPTGTVSTDITFVNGDLNVAAGESGSGLLVVTGRLRFDTDASWNGIVLVIGEGEFERTGATGSGIISGATVVANIGGAALDCSGPDNGFDVAIYTENEASMGDTVYCSTDMIAANPWKTYDIVHFRQR